MKSVRQIEITVPLQQQHLRLFHEVARELTSILDLEQVLTKIMTQMANFFGPERWSMLLVDEAQSELEYAIAIGENSETLKGLRIRLGDGVAGWVAATGNPLIIPDVSLDPHWNAYSKAHPELGIQSIACIPVRSTEKVLGVIQLLNSKFDLLSEYSISFLRMLCDFAAIAIQNSSQMKLIQELSITDDCTGLFNARHLYTLLDETARMQPNTEFSLVFFDLDHFKSVNDTHGHLIGSRLLMEVGNLIKRSIGPSHAAFRYGGDEFVILLNGLGKVAATDLITSIYNTLRNTPFLQATGLSLKLTASFGLATYPADGASVQEIIRSADTMMYEAKAATRDNVWIAGQGLLIKDKAPKPSIPRATVQRDLSAVPGSVMNSRPGASPASGVGGLREERHPDFVSHVGVRQSPIRRG